MGNPQEPTDDAPNVGPFVLRLNGRSFQAGDSLDLSTTVVPSLSPIDVDIYVALALPGGTLLFMGGDGQFSLDIAPFDLGVSVPPFESEIFQYAFTGAEPPGAYSWLGAFTEPETLNVIGEISQTSFSFGD